jgi:hypothetical protein
MQKFAGIVGRVEPAASGRFVNRMLQRMMSTCDSCTAIHEDEEPPFVVGTTWRNYHDSVARLTWNQTREIAILLIGEIYSGRGLTKTMSPTPCCTRTRNIRWISCRNSTAGSAES